MAKEKKSKVIIKPLLQNEPEKHQHCNGKVSPSSTYVRLATSEDIEDPEEVIVHSIS